MISANLQEAINYQINAEMWSSNLYLSMSYYFKGIGYIGFAQWMKMQANEELEHAETMADYLMKRGGKVKITAVDAVPQEWDSPLAAFEAQYKHECQVSSLIDKLVDVASADRDKASQDFLWSFVREQVDEEAIAQGVINQVNLGGQESLYHLDKVLGSSK